MNLLAQSIRNSRRELRTQNGFTLIELLVVISIIGLLSSVVLGSLNEARTESRYAGAQAELRQIVQAIAFAQGESGSILTDITDDGCSRCSCPQDTNLQNISSGSTCYQDWTNALDAIIAAADGLADGIDNAARDPWGSPYLLDENEGEQPGNVCRQDNIRTVGEDGIFNTADDYIVDIPFRLSECVFEN